jgi:hypothetical protein
LRAEEKNLPSQNDGRLFLCDVVRGAKNEMFSDSIFKQPKSSLRHGRASSRRSTTSLPKRSQNVDARDKPEHDEPYCEGSANFKRNFAFPRRAMRPSCS